ncbi:hypothetical protein CcaCcLH18_02913 [Colletotrichum camelliae]|nr:hypothetical protein CcaCcLH18_02913 [Colletotrichum camelliae]
MSDPGTDNPTMLSILSPQPPYPYEWDEEKSNRGQTSISSKLKKIRLPKIEIVDKEIFVKEGRDLLDRVKAGKFQYENETFLNADSIQHHHPVPGNRSHFPQSEQDGCLIDGRHNRDAVDEVWRLTEKHLPRRRSQFSAEVSIEGVGIMDITYEEFKEKVLSMRSHTRRHSLASTESRGRSQSPRTRRASSSHRSRSSHYRPQPLDPRQFATERDRLLNILRPDPRDRCPASRQIELAEALKALGTLFRANGYEDVKVGWIEGRVDLVYSTVDSGTTGVDNEQRTGPRALPLGIPDGKMRPTLAAEAKKYNYVTKAVEEIKRVADEESQSVGDPRTLRGTKEDYRVRRYSENTSDLLRQGGGYMMLYRIMYCELFDTRSHIFMHAPGLKIDEHSTTPRSYGAEPSKPQAQFDISCLPTEHAAEDEMEVVLEEEEAGSASDLNDKEASKANEAA